MWQLSRSRTSLRQARLQGRHEDHGKERRGDGDAGERDRLVGPELARQRDVQERAGDEHQRRRQAEADALPDDVVHVHQTVPRDRIRDDADVEDVSEAAHGVDVDPVDRQEIGEGERRLHDGGEEPELRLDPLPRGSGVPVGAPDPLDREGQVHDQEDGHHRVEPGRFDVPAPRVGRDPTDETPAEVRDREHRPGCVGGGQEPCPDASPGLREEERHVEEDRRGEAHPRAEDAAPPFRRSRGVEVVEGEEVEVPADDGERQGCEDPVQRLASPLSQNERTDHEVRQGRGERHETVVRHGARDRFSGPVSALSSWGLDHEPRGRAGRH